MAGLDLGLEADLAARLVLAAVLGAGIGFEREIHDHPAGMRTHLLVGLGSALFAVVSGYGYAALTHDAGPPDPTRIAAGIVTGIGFLGAGAIIHSGMSIRGLTTAASLWATAAVGLAVGAGTYLLGIIGAALVVFSLWPLRWLVDRLHPRGLRALHLRLQLASLDGLGAVTERAGQAGAELVAIASRKLGPGRYEIELDLRLAARGDAEALLVALGALSQVELVESDADPD